MKGKTFMNPIDCPENQKILSDRANARRKLEGPQVGDYIRLPNLHPKLGKWTRITYDWGDHVQTGSGGSFYVHWRGTMGYSGSLDPGLKKADLVETQETKDGRCWFFDKDLPGAGRGVECSMALRVWDIRPGADLSGLPSRKFQTTNFERPQV